MFKRVSRILCISNTLLLNIIFPLILLDSSSTFPLVNVNVEEKLAQLGALIDIDHHSFKSSRSLLLNVLNPNVLGLPTAVVSCQSYQDFFKAP